MRTGNATVGTSAAAIFGTGDLQYNTKRVVLSADADNTDVIYISERSDVTTSTGFPIYVGAIPFVIEMDTPKTLYAISGASSQVIHWVLNE